MDTDFIKAEHDTIIAMLHIYCKGNHNTNNNLCNCCQELAEYSANQLAHCPYGDTKPTCGNCQSHCYKKSMRERVKKVMKYAGSKMVFQHPLMTLRHLFHGFRNQPTRIRESSKKKVIL